MKNPKRIYIVHGWDSNPYGGWYTWLKRELEQKELEVTICDMPYNQKPDMDVWVSHLFQVIVNPDKNVYLIGHDIGGTTVIRFLERMPANTKIGGVVLVAPLTEAIGQPETDNFFEHNIDFSKVKSHTKKIIGIYSDDDSMVPLKQSETLAKKLGASIIIQEKMKHFSSEAGIVEVPGVLNSILEMTK